MSEIKVELIKIMSGSQYLVNDKIMVADDETYVITESHTLADILRYVVKCANGDVEHISVLLKLMGDEL